MGDEKVMSWLKKFDLVRFVVFTHELD